MNQWARHWIRHSVGTVWIRHSITGIKKSHSCWQILIWWDINSCNSNSVNNKNSIEPLWMKKLSKTMIRIIVLIIIQLMSSYWLRWYSILIKVIKWIQTQLHLLEVFLIIPNNNTLRIQTTITRLNQCPIILEEIPISV